MFENEGYNSDSSIDIGDESRVWNDLGEGDHLEEHRNDLIPLAFVDSTSSHFHERDDLPHLEDEVFDSADRRKLKKKYRDGAAKFCKGGVTIGRCRMMGHPARVRGIN